MGQEHAVHILNTMTPDDRTALIEELPSAAVTQLLRLLSPEELKVAQSLLNYPEGSVGRLMTPEFIAVKDEWTVQQVLDYVREHGMDRETLNVLYIVDADGHLIDDIRIREFLLRPLTAKVSELRDRNFVSLNVTDQERDAVAVFRKYDRTVLPVVDSAGKVVGIVTIDDVLDVAEKEATKAMQKLGGSEAFDEPYLVVGFRQMIRKRAPWLVILFLGEMLTATAMGFFEGEISKAVVLALFIPLIISSGGNSGSQATTLIIRAMALDEVALRDWWKVMRREVFSGLTLGTILGCIGFLRIAVWSAFSTIYGPHWALIGFTIFGSLIGVVMWGTLSGSMLPFILRRCGFDPAAASAPFVATLVDVTGLIIYFTMAMLVLRGTLL
jgi:magnesium transporter